MTTPSSNDPAKANVDDALTALVADLNGIWWIETPDAVVFDRKWLRKNYGPHRRGGDPR